MGAAGASPACFLSLVIFSYTEGWFDNHPSVLIMVGIAGL
jgi:hypothetical protein